jgi:NADH:ubiquinone oxidoreductase subunit F (NADH-binding)/NADH:ubiquinone oxidoreductase subunit E
MTNKNIIYRPIDPDINALVEHYQRNPQSILEILVELQEKKGWLSREAVTDVARVLDIPPEHAYGVASFYSMLTLAPSQEEIIRVCDGPVCWLHGYPFIRRELEQQALSHPNWVIERSSCLGLCDRAPAALVNNHQTGPLTPELAKDVFTGWMGQMPDYSQERPGELRVMMSKAGQVDPDSIRSYLDHGGYAGLQAALASNPLQVIEEVEASGLQGRGGAGFPVGRKWRFVAQEPVSPKYVICNADESEPLIFKDRVLIDTNPHQILEGMAIAGYATGAEEAYIYIRGEYEYQAQRLERAIQQAEENGWLGKLIQDSSFSFYVHVHRGAGAYICGEETALIESLEGKRGEPRNRPPYPPSYGYTGKPTLVNNVESFASVPAILAHGAEWYRSLSKASTPGTKMYMLLGHINRPGLFEAPFGLTLRQVIDDFGGGMIPGSEFNFALSGGAAGTIVPPALLDVPIDYSSVTQGVSLGAGAFLICDQDVSPVAFLKQLLHFFRVESCGKCTPCRVGTYHAHDILEKLDSGRGEAGDITELYKIADVMWDASFCGLGQSVAIPMKSALKHFSDLFIDAESRGVIHDD